MLTWNSKTVLPSVGNPNCLEGYLKIFSTLLAVGKEDFCNHIFECLNIFPVLPAVGKVDFYKKKGNIGHKNVFI